MEKETKCYKCKETVTETYYMEDYYLVEEHFDCPYCGYRYHWAYGYLCSESTDYVQEDTQF